MRTPDNSESYLRFPTSTLLSKPGSVRVLREIIQASEARSIRAVTEGTGLNPQTVRNVLVPIIESGVVEEIGEGRARLYQANRSHPLYMAFGTLFQVEEERFETILESMASAAENITPSPLAVWIYGPAARGEDTANTDLQVALVAADDQVDPAVMRFRNMLEPLQEAQGVWISVVGLSPANVRSMASGDAWWKEATSDCLQIMGDSPEDLVKKLERSRSGNSFRR